MEPGDRQHIMMLLANIPTLKELKLPVFDFVNLDLLDAVDRHSSLLSFVAPIPAKGSFESPPHYYRKLSLGASRFNTFLEYYEDEGQERVSAMPEYLSAFSYGLSIRKMLITASFTKLDYSDHFSALPRNALRHLHTPNFYFFLFLFIFFNPGLLSLEKADVRPLL